MEYDWKNELVDSSKALLLFHVNQCVKQPELIAPLFKLALEQKIPLSQRASRVFCNAMLERGDLLVHYLDIILDEIPKIVDESIRFNFMKIFTACKLPEDEEKLGLLTNICFDLIETKIERIALKVYAADTLYRISKIYPDIKRELIFLFDKYRAGEKIAFKNRASKIRMKLIKELGVDFEEEEGIGDD